MENVYDQDKYLCLHFLYDARTHRAMHALACHLVWGFMYLCWSQFTCSVFTFIPYSCDISLQSCLFCLLASSPDHLPAAWTQAKVTERLERNCSLPPSLPVMQPRLGCTTCTIVKLLVYHLKALLSTTCSCTVYMYCMATYV